MKKSKLLAIIGVVATFSVASSIFVASTAARYFETVAGTSTANVAPFEFSVDIGDDGELSVESDADFNLFDEEDIVPGSSGTMEIVITNTSSLPIEFNMDVLEITSEASANLPIVYEYNDRYYSNFDYAGIQDGGYTEDEEVYKSKNLYFYQNETEYVELYSTDAISKLIQGINNSYKMDEENALVYLNPNESYTIYIDWFWATSITTDEGSPLDGISAYEYYVSKFEDSTYEIYMEMTAEQVLTMEEVIKNHSNVEDIKPLS